MTKLKLKIKKTLLKRKIDGAVIEGYYGRVVTNGRVDFEQIAKDSAKNTSLHPAEAELAAKLLLEGVCECIKQGLIVDLGPLGRLYPAVNSKWVEDPDELTLSDMTPKVNYKPSDEIFGAVKSATVSWVSKKDGDEEEEDPENPDEPGNDEPLTVEAPVIRGTTPFAETTQVSISGPDGARVYYTTNGSTPTSASTLYSAAFTLSDTATVKAIAIKDGVSSNVTSKTFTKTNWSEGPESE